VPDRAFWVPLAPDLFKLIGRDYAIGTRSSVLSVGGVKVGVDICFDIVDDGLILGSVSDGAQVLVAQTNNADFGTTEEHEQQLAIARMRAIETGRSVVSSSTVASTTVIAPDGVTLQAAKPFTRQTLVADVPLATGTTPAVAFGVGLGATIALLGGVLPLIAAGLARPLRRKRRTASFG
jgi:apolipoprotein N-acyltransferase